MAQQRGFTLLELIITLVIIGIMFSIAALGLQGFRQRLELREAQRTLVSVLNRARSDARRLSVDQTLTWQAGESVLELVAGNGNKREIHLSSGNVVFKTSDTISYTAPYGRTKATPEDILLTHRRLDVPAEIIIYGVTGKVKAVAR